MLVMLILVLASALAIPTLSGSLDGFRLKKSADLVRAQWAHTRNNAMETGRIHVFRYETGGDRYWSEPWYAENDTTQAVSGEDLTGPSYGKHLPDTVQFASGETQSTTRSANVEESATSGVATNEASLGRPIVFYPDGTASTAKLYLQNERGKFILIDLRGLTGIATVSDVFSAENVPQ